MRVSGVIAVVFWAGLPVLTAGCSPSGMRAGGPQASGAFKPSTAGFGDGTEDPDEEWIVEASKEARAYRPGETDPDGWWARLFMSEKARSIERNVGIAYD